MKMSYFGYFLRHRLTNERYLCDLSRMIIAFAKCGNAFLKGSFQHNSEHVYLQGLSGDVCVLVMTRDADKFKTINTSNLSIREIRNLLGQDEKIGFASYLVVKKNFFGFASASFSPKFDAFTAIMNQILSYTNNPQLEFCIKPLSYQATKQEAVQMNYIGRTTIEITHENTLTRDFLCLIGAETNTEEFSSLEITIKPRRRRSVKSVVEKVIEHASDEGLQRLFMKAKNDAASSMLDIYITGKGVISDSITTDESLLVEMIESRIKENIMLKDQLKAFEADEMDSKASFDWIAHYSDVDSWSSLADDLQSDYRLR